MLTNKKILWFQIFGSNNLLCIGVVLQRAILILLLACFPCWAIHINTEPILLAVKQEPAVARSKFTSCHALVVFSFLFFFSLLTDKTSFLLILMENLSVGWLSCMWRSLCQRFLWVCSNLNVKQKFCVWSFTCYTLSSTCWDRLLWVITSSQTMYVCCVHVYIFYVFVALSRLHLCMHYSQDTYKTRWVHSLGFASCYPKKYSGIK